MLFPLNYIPVGQSLRFQSWISNDEFIQSWIQSWIPSWARSRSFMTDNHFRQSICLQVHLRQSICLQIHTRQSVCLQVHLEQSICLQIHFGQSICLFEAIYLPADPLEAIYLPADPLEATYLLANPLPILCIPLCHQPRAKLLDVLVFPNSHRLKIPLPPVSQWHLVWHPTMGITKSTGLIKLTPS